MPNVSREIDRSKIPGSLEIPQYQKRNRVLQGFFRTTGLLTIDPCEAYQITEDRKSGIRINMKEAWDNPLLLRDTAYLLKETTGLDTMHCIVGIESGGSPFAALLANLVPAKLRLIRKQETELKSILAGSSDTYIGNVLVVDDVLGTGESLIRSLGAISSYASETSFLSVFSYGSEKRLRSELGISVQSLFQAGDLVAQIEDNTARESALRELEKYQTKIGVIA